jgi:hypothetical protein
MIIHRPCVGVEPKQTAVGLSNTAVLLSGHKWIGCGVEDQYAE